MIIMKFILPRFLVNIERWKWNDEYRIYVSNTGRFKDEYKKELPIKIGDNGYCYIQTYIGFKIAHRIVMMTWRPTRNMEDLTVDHLDHNKRNNTLSNLEWVSFEENQSRAKKDQIHINTNKRSTSIKRKLTYGRKRLAYFDSYEEAAQYVMKNIVSEADKPNAKLENIERKICNAVTNEKTYYGYKWKWVDIYE